jgi:prepilin-type N-terminal cleavage/methylation domain-containing protein
MQRGFSLVELSIVLVILGLLTGGILAGQSLIRASELRAVISDIQRYQTAVHTFRDKYFALPGDMPNAQSFWGIAHATPATCITTIGSGTATCNGDGDGFIEYLSTGSNETFRFFQHLANAGLIEGSYTGIEGSLGNAVHAIPGVNVPKSKLANMGPSLYYYPTTPAGMYPNSTGNVLFYGLTLGNSVTNGLSFKAEEQWGFDTKIDDSKPAYGYLRSYNNTTRPNCVTSDTASSAEYTLSSTATGCSLIWISGF